MAQPQSTPQAEHVLKDKEFKDLGFGSALDKKAQRLINRDGSLNVRRKGIRLQDIHLYHTLIQLSWPRFWLSVLAFYVLLNSLFAAFYMLIGVEQLSGHPIEGNGVKDFAFAFYFSVQTFTTVGYGAISPSGHPANLIASLEAMIGLMAFAFAASILYGRFARPNARILYSEKALFAPYQDRCNAFMFRIVNGRMNQLLELEAKIIMTWFPKGRHEKRQYALLPLERRSVTLFPLSWTVVHPIDEESPLFGLSQLELAACSPEFMIVIKAYDDTFAQEVNSRTSYKYENCIWGAKFLPMFHTDDEGVMVVELDKLSDCTAATLI